MVRTSTVQHTRSSTGRSAPEGVGPAPFGGGSLTVRSTRPGRVRTPAPLEILDDVGGARPAAAAVGRLHPEREVGPGRHREMRWIPPPSLGRRGAPIGAPPSTTGPGARALRRWCRTKWRDRASERCRPDRRPAARSGVRNHGTDGSVGATSDRARQENAGPPGTEVNGAHRPPAGVVVQGHVRRARPSGRTGAQRQEARRPPLARVSVRRRPPPHRGRPGRGQDLARQSDREVDRWGVAAYPVHA